MICLPDPQLEMYIKLGFILVLQPLSADRVSDHSSDRLNSGMSKHGEALKQEAALRGEACALHTSMRRQLSVVFDPMFLLCSPEKYDECDHDEF